MKNTIIEYLKAGYPCLHIQTTEDTRLQATMLRAVKDLGRELIAYNFITGKLNVSTGSGGPLPPDELLEAIRDSAPKPGVKEWGPVWFIEDWHLMLEAGKENPTFIAEMKQTIRHCKARGVSIVMVGARRVLPPEIEREVTAIQFELPTPEELTEVVFAISESAKLDKPEGDELNRILCSLGGLTANQAEDALSLAFVRKGNLCPIAIADEKAVQLGKDGLVTMVKGTTDLSQIGGMKLAKEWINQRRRAFTPEAREFGLPTPKGVLLLGLPGTGKSLFSKAVGSILGLPILKVDMGSLFGSLVGESEERTRKVIQIAEAMSPCIVQFEEIDKGIGGSAGGNNDSGTSDRVLATLLDWMQEKTKPVFVVATANDPERLAASDGALVRKGRFDELFFVDLPTVEEREAIWRIKLNAVGRKADDYSPDMLAHATENFTGAEIEACVTEALYTAFDAERQIELRDLVDATDRITPLYETYKSRIEATRKWAATRCRMASDSDQSFEGPSGGRRLSA